MSNISLYKHFKHAWRQPILCIKAKIESGKIIHVFYKKPLSNDRVILANSAMPHSTKMASMVNEAIRRLRNNSRALPWATKTNIYTHYTDQDIIRGRREERRNYVISRESWFRPTHDVGLISATEGSWLVNGEKSGTSLATATLLSCPNLSGCLLPDGGHRDITHQGWG